MILCGYLFTPRAYRHLGSILSYIAEENEGASRDVEDVILRNCELLAVAPGAGKLCSWSTKRKVRMWVANPYNNYLIVYEPDTKPVRIVAVMHGARNLPKLIL